MNWRLFTAIAAFVALAGVSCIVLSGVALKAVLILYAGLLAKTLIAWKGKL